MKALDEMEKYVAFLRGINVSGQKKIKMAALRESLTKKKVKEVQTYIQSGNLLFASESNDRGELEKKIHQVIEMDFGFDVPVLVLSTSEIDSILLNNPFSKVAEEKNQYFALLHEVPANEMMSNIDPSDYPNEDFELLKNCFYLNCKKGAGKAKLTNNVIERKLKVIATTRNLNTMRKMLELANYKSNNQKF